MTRIRNPLAGGNYVSPLGQAFGNAFNMLAALPSPLERASMDATMRYRTAQADKAQQDIRDARTKSQAAITLGDLFSRAYGQLEERDRPDDDMQGPMPALNRDEQVRKYMPQMVTAATQAGGLNQLGQLFRTYVANADGTTDTAISRAMMGAGDAVGHTPVGAASEQALKREIEMNRDNRQAASHAAASERAARTQADIAARTLVPVLENGRWVYRPSAEAAGLEAPTPASAANKTPRNYVAPGGVRGMTFDGVTDAHDGTAIPQGSQVFTGQVQSMSDLTPAQRGTTAIAGEKLDQFKTTLASLREFGANPANFGIAGNLRAFGQNVAENLGALSRAFGRPPEAIQQMLDAAMAPASPGFDPTLPRLTLLADLAAYRAAETLAQQSGRGLSDNDVKRFRVIVGDPRALLSNQAEFFARLDQLEQEVNREVEANRRLLGPTPATPRPAVKTIDLDGNVIQ